MEFDNDSMGDSSAVKSLYQQIADLNAMLTEARSEMSKVQESQHSVKAAIQENRDETAKVNYELQQQILANNQECEKRTAVMQQEYTGLEETRWDLQKKVREAEKLADSIQRQIDQQRRAELASQEWATLEKRWDLLTMGAPWREWAKDHQLDGARKITYEGKMILGDPMGLGKTLTSIITLDMIEAATKDASPNNPIEFGSIK